MSLDVREAEYTIRIQRNDANDIAYAIMHDLKRSIETHYNHLQQGKDGEDIFYDHNKNQIKIMEFMFGIIGEARMFESYMREFKSIFEARRKERLEAAGGKHE